jgi:four helix bundle protein
VVEECDETLFWLELINKSKLISSEKLSDLINQTTGLLAVFSKTKKAIKEKYL